MYIIICTVDRIRVYLNFEQLDYDYDYVLELITNYHICLMVLFSFNLILIM